MAKLIVAINISEDEARKIEAQAKGRHSVELNEDGVPNGYFNPDGSISIDSAMLEEDVFDDTFFVFEYQHVNYD